MNASNMRLKHRIRLLAIGLSFFHEASVAGQVINDPFEEVGDETYSGGFGSFNWVSATGFGFTDHAGAEGFLSNYTGTPLPNIGMVKPLGGSIANTTYRVSFYYSRYSSPNAVPFSDYNFLYIGSANGTMIWDTVPTPAVHGVWVKWSGSFTPDIGDIGQPFLFGFELTLNSGSSLAIDGPVIVQDLVTGIPEDRPHDALEVQFAPGLPYVTIHCDVPIVGTIVFDAQGRCVSADRRAVGNEQRVEVALLPPGHYGVRCLCADGSLRIGRFVVV